MNTIEKQILNETKDLPLKKKNDVLGFIQFLKAKKLRKTPTKKDSLNVELSIMDQKELSHLEEEFKNYKDLYPYEK